LLSDRVPTNVRCTSHQDDDEEDEGGRSCEFKRARPLAAASKKLGRSRLVGLSAQYGNNLTERIKPTPSFGNSSLFPSTST
jgi:hypothetical protein